jgi:predicted AAA+ superfamily ATPase
MRSMKRLYESIIREHLREERQMVFLAGPRQVGKTTICRDFLKPDVYYLWDRPDDRRIITQGPTKVAEHAELDALRRANPLVVFDEIHKYGRWKRFLKGFFDTYGDQVRIIVTGSARLDVYKKGGDSLMGRYFLYRIHPLSVGELLRTQISEREIHPPKRIGDSRWEALVTYGGFPEPFVKANRRFANRWNRLRTQQLFRQDIRDLTRVQELDQMEMLAEVLRHQSGRLVSYTALADQVNVSVDTVRRWIPLLESFYYCFRIRPWFRNVPKSLRKEPKLFLNDWSSVDDPGRRAETFVACHLLKAVRWWQDMGLGDYGLHYLRDKAKREVDFLVSRNNRPWFLVEVKSSGRRPMSKALAYFQQKTGAAHAFQISFDAPFVDADCFEHQLPVRVPARTLLSQLV